MPAECGFACAPERQQSVLSAAPTFSQPAPAALPEARQPSPAKRPPQVLEANMPLGWVLPRSPHAAAWHLALPPPRPLLH